MLFNSRIFLFLFFPVLLILYYGFHKAARHKTAQVLLIAASFVFYGYNHYSYLILLSGSILFNYGVFLWMQKVRKGKKLIAAFAVAANLGVLFYFKYFDFFLSNCNSIFHTDFAMRNILLPLGISFFTFQQISFIVDSYKGEMKQYTFLEYCLFVSLFPQLVAGPIVLHDELVPQFREEERYRINWDRFSDGLKYFIIGLSKKTLVADSFAKIADAGFVDQMDWDALSAFLIVTGYVFQLYFDFSGYSDMAVGLGKMLGFDLPKNFDEPLKSKNQAQFWNRWHMSLIRFLTRYVYIPLGGSRKGKVRTYINIMLVFIISGIWHGAGWNYVAWGILCGLGSVFYRLFQKVIDRLPAWISVFFNFFYFVFTCIFFRAAYLSQAKEMCLSLLKLRPNGSVYELCNDFALGYNDSASLAVTLAAFVFTSLLVFAAPSSHRIVNGELRLPAVFRKEKAEMIFYGVLAALCILTFANVSSFIYFNF